MLSDLKVSAADDDERVKEKRCSTRERFLMNRCQEKVRKVKGKEKNLSWKESRFWKEKDQEGGKREKVFSCHDSEVRKNDLSEFTSSSSSSNVFQPHFSEFRSLSLCFHPLSLHFSIIFSSRPSYALRYTMVIKKWRRKVDSLREREREKEWAEGCVWCFSNEKSPSSVMCEKLTLIAFIRWLMKSN